MPDTPSLDTIAPALVDWDRVRASKYLVRQTFYYEYPAHIYDLRHQLMVIPPATFGDQRRTVYSLQTSEAGEVITRMDAFANTVLDVHIPFVQRSIEFATWMTIERSGPVRPREVPGSWLRDPTLFATTHRTTPDAAITQAAAELRASGATGLALAERVNLWVHDRLEYRRGVTDVHTTAAEALAIGGGVCQDYSHVMIAICRLLGLPTQYVSGHQLGEGGTHSWVEVLLPAVDGSDRAEGWPLDPTHGCRSDLSYLTIAVGRDYGDVAPTSGSYRAGHGGSLAAHREVLVTEIEYFD
ncbi:MAG: transglutaminase family protein [Dehalococcoidia bacterium]